MYKIIKKSYILNAFFFLFFIKSECVYFHPW